MKVEARILDVDSTLDGEKVAMGIDEAAFAHIMSVLTDLYSDPELAVLREYSTNALDSHVEAGVKRPIEITLPSPLSPFLRIRDYGVGLNADDIRSVYSRYGTSTKRDSNDVVGMLGLGCKSALTYADQFTVTGHKNGVAVQVSVSRDEDGAGSMTLVAEHPTTEQGVEIVIPAKRHHAFETKADELFRFWQPGTVLVNGEAPERIDGIWLDESMLCVRGVELDGDYIVMGNVPYPWPDADESVDPYRRSRRGYHRVVWVPIGAVQFTPSREALQMTKLTRETLARVKYEFHSKLDATLSQRVEQATSPQEAIERLVEVQSMGLSAGANPTYMGRPVSTNFTRPLDRFTAEGNGFLIAQPNAYRYKKGGEWHADCTILHSSGYGVAATVGSTIWLEGFEGKELTLVRRNKLAYFLGQKGITEHLRIVAVKEFTADEKWWLQGARVYKFEDVDAVKLPKEERKNEDGRPKGSYRGRAPGETTWHKPILAENIDTSKPIFWLHGNQYVGQGDYAVRQGIIPSDAYIICLDGRRIDKFCRDFPTAEKLHDGAVRLCKAWVDTQDAGKVLAARAQANGVSCTKLRPLDPTRIDDPELAKLVELANVDATSVIQGFELRQRWITLRDGSLLKPVEKYPLIENAGSLGGKAAEHVYLYVNEAYKAAQQKGAS